MRAAAVALLAAWVGCSGKNVLEPGTVVGTFRFDGKKQAATCGDASSAPDPWVFDVRLSRDGPKLYWLQNRAPVTGAVAPDRRVTLRVESVTVVRAATRTRRACTVRRTDALEGALGPDEPLGDSPGGGFSTLAGTLSYDLAAEDDSDCEGLAAADLSVLPCKTVYAVSGRKIAP